MACPICGANCRCKNAGPGGVCCGCHRHKSQKGFSRAQLDRWRIQHELLPIEDRQWQRSYAKHATPAADDPVLPFSEVP